MTDAMVNFEYMKTTYELVDKLSAEGIPFEVRFLLNGFQVAYPDNGDNRVCSAICHNGSYGRGNGYMEIMGLLTADEATYDDVVVLTVDEIFRRIKEHYHSNQES
jgi:hypothetical protein